MKDAYYFSHDSNAKDDPKCMMLIETLQLEGYGIFWMLVETLRDQPNYKYPVALIPALARRYNTTPDKLKTVVYNFGLFEIENEEFFYSHSLNRRMEKWDIRREQRRLAGIASGKARRQKALPEQPFNGRSTNAELRKDKKGKDIEKKRDIKHKHGEYNHVLLTDKQYEELKTCVDDREKWIKIIDDSIEEKGNIYKIVNFKMAAIKWYKRELEKNPAEKKLSPEAEKLMKMAFDRSRK